MQILCVFGLLFAVTQFNSALLQSIGRARLVFRISLAGTILQIAFFAVAVNFGIRWVAARSCCARTCSRPCTSRRRPASWTRRCGSSSWRRGAGGERR